MASNIINRWRHTLGYGVHSPLAYRIIKECVHPDKRYAYYVDSRIDYLYANSPEKAQQMRLLVRLFNVVNPTLVLIPDADKKIKEILSEAYPKLKVSSNIRTAKNIDFIVAFDSSGFEKYWKFLNTDTNSGLIVFPPFNKVSETTTSSKNLSSLPTLILRSDDFTLYLRREGMQKTEYDLL